MGTEENVQTVKDFLAAIGRGDKEGLLALVAEDIEWIIPGEDWPLAGTHRGRAGVVDAFRKASEEVPFTYPEPPNMWRREIGFWSILRDWPMNCLGRHCSSLSQHPFAVCIPPRASSGARKL
ncbi:nuclear transport factor 2 family protein [Azospirillum sp. A29]|uniref:nuclear transport factor 2 family protein n=1 Tax=Azospirillum sp. A29 TaxID=3160606 RepID=UPI0036736010